MPLFIPYKTLATTTVFGEKMIPALVFNCNFNGLALIQSLGKRGVPVYALDSERAVGTYSKYAKFMRVPNPLVDEEGFVSALLRFDHGQTKPLLLPTNDHWAEAIALHGEILSDRYTLCTPGRHIVDLLLDKYQFAIWAARHEFAIPSVWLPSEIEECGLSGIDYPIALKAKGRRSISNSSEGKDKAKKADALRFLICRNENELREAIKKARQWGVECYCQQVVVGDSSSMRTIGIYASKGEIKGLLYGRKVRGYPPQHGDCVVGEAQTVPGWARELAVNFAKVTNYTGIAEIELMEDRESGIHYLIEVNPRSWSWIGVGAPAGVDFAWLAYQDLVLGREVGYHESCEHDSPVRYVKVLQDLPNVLIWNRLAGCPGWTMSPVRWWRELRSANCVIAEFPSRDWAVSLAAVVEATRFNFVKALRLMTAGRRDR